MNRPNSGAVPIALTLLVALVAVLTVCFCPYVEYWVRENERTIEACGTIFVATFTCTLWIATQKLGTLALRQGEAMERSIAEQTRATEATISIAAASKQNAELARSIMQKQLRAYISVEAGQATYQDINLRFAAMPVFTNTGFTPARNVSHHVMAAVLQTHLHDDYRFEEFGEKKGNDATLSPRQSFSMFRGVVRERYPDHEVEDIMKGDTRRLYVWGIITYDDIFGEKWETNFCFNYVFLRPDDKNVKDVRVSSYIFHRHNSST